MTTLKSGDLVVLKSGGPVMTVDTVNTDILDDSKVTGVLCAWFVGAKLERARFDYNAVVPAPPQEASSENAQQRGPEASGEYKVVLDEMVATMNDSAEASGEVSQTPLRKPRKASVGKGAADATASTARGMN